MSKRAVPFASCDGFLHRSLRAAFGLSVCYMLGWTSCAAQSMALSGKLDVNATGAAIYSIDIAVPPGTASLTPTLSLTYNSQGGDGLLGLGWSLSGLPTITRCPLMAYVSSSTLAPTATSRMPSRGVRHDNRDLFCMDGQLLAVRVPAHVGYGTDGAEYELALDRFTKVVSRGVAGTGPAWFEVRTKSGLIMEFGNTPDSRLLAAGKPTAHAWAVNRISDAAGNYISVSYTNDAMNTQLYPLRIDYTGNSAAGLAPYNSVRFVYESRSDIAPLYQQGSLMKLTQRLTAVRAYDSAALVSDYRLTYQESSSTGRSLLASIAHCDQIGICLPATNFSWLQGPATPTVVSNVAGENGTLSGSVPLLGDFNGDGLPDILWDAQSSASASTGTRVLWTNAGSGNFTITPNFGNFNGTLSGYYPIVADFNGDGRSDVWWYQRSSLGFVSDNATQRWFSQLGGSWQLSAGPAAGFIYPSTDQVTMLGLADLNGDGSSDLWSRAQMIAGIGSTPAGSINIWDMTPSGWSPTPRCSSAPRCSTIAWIPQDPDYSWNRALYMIPYVADFNGDGADDFIATTVRPNQAVPSRAAQFLWTRGDTGGFAEPWKQIESSNIDYHTPLFLDINGDGKSDVLWDLTDSSGRSVGTRIIWLSKGDGTFEFVSNPGGTNGSLVGYIPWAGDFNGDGRADVLWVQSDGSKLSSGARVLWQGKGDGTFTIVSNFGGQDGTLVGYSPVLGDFNGDGKTDVMWDSRSGSDTRSTGTRVLWLSDGPVPDLMSGIANGLGANVTLTYKPLTDSSVYSQDGVEPDPHPEQILNLRVRQYRGAMYVVSRVDVSNGVGGTLGTSYSYAGAKSLPFHNVGFIGFRQRIATDVQTNIAHKTIFRQKWPFHLQIANETRELGTVTLSSIVNTYSETCGYSFNLCWNQFNEYFGEYCECWRSDLQQTVVSGRDLDGTLLPATTTIYQYDVYGSATQVAVSTSDGHSKTTTHTYTNDLTNWRLGRMSSVSVTSQNAQGSITRTSSFGYDVATGLLTQEVIEPNQNAYRVQTDYTLDGFGNRLSATVSGAGIAARNATTVYDARGQFRSSSANALGHGESGQFDLRFGLPTSQTGPNGLTTTWSYDSFGRKVLEVRADGTRTAWSYQYCSGTAGGTASCPAGGRYLVQMTSLASDGTTQIGAIVTSYHDQLGRVIANDIQGFDGSLIRSATQYDALGRVAQRSRPYFVTGGTPRWHIYNYDVLGRVLTETAPDSSVSLRTYQGLVASETNALSQTRTLVKNSQGEVVSAADALSQTTAYVYDAFGNVTQVTDPVGNVSTFAYDVRGRKTASHTPDMGSWSYAYNVLGEATTQTDAKAQVTSLSYDVLGRMTLRIEPGLTSTWTYDTAANGIGKLAIASTNGGYQRTHIYDALGRPIQLQVTAGAATHAISTDYDSASRISTVTYPNGFAVAYAYNAYGYQTELRNSATSQVLWTANARDAELHVTQQTAGNGVVTSQSFNADSGRLTGILAGTASAVQSFSYTHDAIGNLLSRADANTGMSESFGYDGLNRVTSATVGMSLAKAFTYDGVGNLLSKSDVGNYSYPTPGQPRPHGVVSIGGGMLSTTFTYDPNGNQTAGAGLTIGYTSFNKPASITRGTTTISFDHDPEHQRYLQNAPTGTTLYMSDAMGSGARAEKFSGAGGLVRWDNYLSTDGETIGVQVEFSDETIYTRYFHKDHLGSIATITDESGVVLERLSYDTWGKRRHPNGSDDPAGAITSQATRGYTGHEALSDVALVHMNARVYDPFIGRVTSADSIVPDPTNSQAWNRYSYVVNNPLAYVDPTGHTQVLPEISVTATRGFQGISWGDVWIGSLGTCCGWGFHFGNVYGVGITNYGYFPWTSSIATVTTPMSYGVGAPRSDSSQNSTHRSPLLGIANVSAGDVWKVGPSHPVKDALPGGAGYAVTSNAYANANGQNGASVGQSLARGTMNLVPGAYYSGLGQQQFAAGNYGSAAIYGAVSLADAALGTLTLGLSTRLTAAVRAGQGGRFGDLLSRGLVGDKLTPHHMPQAAAGYTNRADGGALVMTEAEHQLTRTFGFKGARTAQQEAGMAFRDVLARDIRDVRSITGSSYTAGTRDLLNYYRSNFPELMAK